MLKIALIRPGTTDYDAQERIQGTLDIPLNDQGLAEAAQAAEDLRDKGLEVIYAPPSEPAFRTAQNHFRDPGHKNAKLVHMENLNQGLWQGMLVEDVPPKTPQGLSPMAGAARKRLPARG